MAQHSDPNHLSPHPIQSEAPPSALPTIPTTSADSGFDGTFGRTHDVRKRWWQNPATQVTTLLVGFLLVICTIRGWIACSQYSEAKLAKAKIDLHAIAEQVSIYKANNGTFPVNITELTERGPRACILPPERAVDPWGQPYQLEVNNDGSAVVFTVHDGVRISDEVKALSK
jgi:hypothetical protein